MSEEQDPLLLMMQQLELKYQQMLSQLNEEQLGHMQFMVDQVKDPEGMRTFVIPKINLMSSEDFPFFMTRYLYDQEVYNYAVYDLTDPDYVTINFY
jgi:hypothetical protein